MGSNTRSEISFSLWNMFLFFKITMLSQSLVGSSDRLLFGWWWLLRWNVKFCFCSNRNEQMGQTKCSSPVCVRKCLPKVDFCLNRIGQCWQMYGFTFEWLCKWDFKFPFVVHFIGHLGHENGLSPVWIRTCTDKLYLSRNGLVQNSQTIIDFPFKWSGTLWCGVWRIMFRSHSLGWHSRICFSNADNWRNPRKHSSQE